MGNVKSKKAPCQQVSEIVTERSFMLMNTERNYYRVDRRRINFIRFIFEAYEGLAVVTTIEATAGLIKLAVAPGCSAVADGIMQDLGRHIMIERLDGLTDPSGVCRESADDS